jgi:ABC-type Fe3+-hydroxamate transport system substrate-binding protein
MRHTDHLGYTIELKQPPQNIISLVPSQTELLFHLGLDKEVKGITKFCVHPQEWFRTKTRIGGTKTLNLEKIKQLQPDLIIANKEENVREQVEALSKDFPVWTSDVNDLPTALDMMASIGIITGKEKEAQNLAAQIQTAFAGFKPPATTRQPNTAYLIWREPYMTAGGDTFIHQMLAYAGFQNIFASEKRYPQITVSALQSLNCELLLLSSEPYPFNRKHVDELQAFLPHTKIALVDGELFSWYGSRLLQAPGYFNKLHKELIPVTR